MKKIILLFILVLFITGCTVEGSETPSKSKQYKVLESEGYENIELTSPVLFGCSDSDSILFNKNFIATKNGNKIEGYVCGALFKGFTIRIK